VDDCFDQVKRSVSRSARAFAVICLVAVAVATATLGYFRGREYVFRFSEEELQDSLAQSMPFTRTYVLVIDVTLTEPRLDLIDGSDRVAAGIDVGVSLPGLAAPITVDGSIDVTTGLRYEPGSGEFYLEDPDLRGFSLQGVPAAYDGPVRDALLRAVSEYFRGRPVYRLDGRDLRHATARLLLKDVTVSDRELIVTLGL
jgi:hypothetical protein